MEFNLEGFLAGKFARGVRWCLFGACVYGVFSEYHVMHGYEAFDRKEARKWMVDYSPVSKPKAQLYVLPDLLYPNYSPWTPINGQVVEGRVVPNHPQWVQLLGGRYVERSSCGIELLVPVEDYERVKLAREQELVPTVGAQALGSEGDRNKRLLGEKSFFARFVEKNNGNQPLSK